MSPDPGSGLAAGVGFCSSGGLSVLVDAVANAPGRGIACAVIAGQCAVVRPIKLLLLDRILPIHADRADADEWLSLVARRRWTRATPLHLRRSSCSSRA